MAQSTYRSENVKAMKSFQKIMKELGYKTHLTKDQFPTLTITFGEYPDSLKWEFFAEELFDKLLKSK